MNSIIKSIFIVVFPLLAIIAMIDSLWFMWSIFEFSVQHVAHFCTAACIVFYFVNCYIKPTLNDDHSLQNYTFVIFVGCLLGLLAMTLIEDEVIRISCLLLNLTLTICWIVYLLWYSFFQQRDASKNPVLKEGSVFPTLTFTTIHSEEISTKEFAGTPSIYIFYRGNWCPFCMAQMKQMALYEKELILQKVNIVFVSSQPTRFSERLIGKYPLDFHFLTDPENVNAKKLHILDARGLPMGFQLFGFGSHTSLPTVIITDSNEKIVYTNQTDNYRERPEPTTLLQVIDQLSEA